MLPRHNSQPGPQSSIGKVECGCGDLTFPREFRISPLFLCCILDLSLLALDFVQALIVLRWVILLEVLARVRREMQAVVVLVRIELRFLVVRFRDLLDSRVEIVV